MALGSRCTGFLDQSLASVWMTRAVFYSVYNHADRLLNRAAVTTDGAFIRTVHSLGISVQTGAQTTWTSAACPGPKRAKPSALMQAPRVY
jgi:hypothetical protein